MISEEYSAGHRLSPFADCTRGCLGMNWIVTVACSDESDPSRIQKQPHGKNWKAVPDAALERGKERGQKSEDNSNCLETFIQRTQKGRTRREGRTSCPGRDGGGERSPREAMPRDRRKHAPPELHQVNGRRHDDSASKAALAGHFKAKRLRLQVCSGGWWHVYVATHVLNVGVGRYPSVGEVVTQCQHRRARSEHAGSAERMLDNSESLPGPAFQNLKA